MERAGIFVLLFLVAVFVAPSTTRQVLAAGFEMMTIAAAETEEGYDDYQDYREEAAADINSQLEDEENAVEQGEPEPSIQEGEEPEEVEEPDLDFDEAEPDS